MKLKIETSNRILAERNPLPNLMITPPIDEDFWLARVPVSESQAIVCFPKFGTIGCGFQHEEDWNTNLPLSTQAERIFEHISHNKGSAKIPDARCIEAIKLLQAFMEKAAA